jgi:lupus La protein
VEFYFSDSNLPRDSFLKDKVYNDPEGYVDIALLCTFKRMVVLLNNGTGFRDPSWVPAAMVTDVAVALEGSTLVAVSEDGKRVRRIEVRLRLEGAN